MATTIPGNITVISGRIWTLTQCTKYEQVTDSNMLACGAKTIIKQYLEVSDNISSVSSLDIEAFKKFLERAPAWIQTLLEQLPEEGANKRMTDYVITIEAVGETVESTCIPQEAFDDVETFNAVVGSLRENILKEQSV